MEGKHITEFDLNRCIFLLLTKVCGTCTNVKKIQTYRSEGIRAYLFDASTGPMIQPEATDDLINSNYILSTVPPVGDILNDAVLNYHAIDIRKAALSNNLKWIGYLSSTGVYGDRGGAWVTEEDSVRPDNARTTARVKCEENWFLLKVMNTQHLIEQSLFSIIIIFIYVCIRYST